MCFRAGGEPGKRRLARRAARSAAVVAHVVGIKFVKCLLARARRLLLPLSLPSSVTFTSAAALGIILLRALWAGALARCLSCSLAGFVPFACACALFGAGFHLCATCWLLWPLRQHVLQRFGSKSARRRRSEVQVQRSLHALQLIHLVPPSCDLCASLLQCELALRRSC